MITLEKQIELLAQLSVEFQYRLQEQDSGWYVFFKEHDTAIPLATLIYIRIADFPKDRMKYMEATMLIRRAFFDLCDVMDIERGRKHLSISDMFRNSPNHTLVELDEDVMGWGSVGTLEDRNV